MSIRWRTVFGPFLDLFFAYFFQYLICYFADGSLSSRGGKDLYVVFCSGSACDGFDFEAGIGRATGVADGAEEVYIVDIVSDVADLIEGDAELSAYLRSSL